MNKRNLKAENDALLEALMEAYNSIEAAIITIDGFVTESGSDDDDEEDDDE